MWAALNNQFVAASSLKEFRAIGSQMHRTPSLQPFLGTLCECLLANFLTKSFPFLENLLPPWMLLASAIGHMTP